MNAKMPELIRAFTSAGFSEVKTVLATGNVNFSSRATPLAKLQNVAEAAMTKELGKTFLTIVRELAELERILASDPYARFKLPAASKRVLTFLREPLREEPRLPIQLADARILAIERGTAFGAYLPGDDGPAFMRLIERTLGKQVSTRTWETVVKIVKAG